MRDDHPPYDEVEEEHGVGGQHLPPVGLAVAQELHGRVRRPRQTTQHRQGPVEKIIFQYDFIKSRGKNRRYLTKNNADECPANSAILQTTRLMLRGKRQ